MISFSPCCIWLAWIKQYCTFHCRHRVSCGADRWDLVYPDHVHLFYIQISLLIRLSSHTFVHWSTVRNCFIASFVSPFIRHRVFYPRPNELDQLYQGFCRRFSPNLFSFHLNPSLFKPFIPILKFPSTPFHCLFNKGEAIACSFSVPYKWIQNNIYKETASFSFELSCAESMIWSENIFHFESWWISFHSAHFVLVRYPGRRDQRVN